MSDTRDHLSGLDDRGKIEYLIAGSIIAKQQNQDGDVVTTAEHMLPVLTRCLENMKLLDERTAKLCNVSEDLAIERMSNKRMKDLLADLAGVLCGNPVCYPAPLRDLVARIHREVGL